MVMSLYQTLKSRTGTYRRRKHRTLDPLVATPATVAATNINANASASASLQATAAQQHQQHQHQQQQLPQHFSSSLPPSGAPLSLSLGGSLNVFNTAGGSTGNIHQLQQQLQLQHQYQQQQQLQQVQLASIVSYALQAPPPNPAIHHGTGTVPREMVSRRKILSRSRDDLNLEQQYQQQSQQDDEDDVWYQKDKLYKEHIQEVLDKWTQIDDEIWAKVIVFERNRRVAKAYARAPVLTINGSDDGFDGMRIGLSGFDNPLRDPKTDELKKHVGQGVKIKMDDAGNILIRRYAKSNVYVKSTASGPNEETAIGADILKLPNQALEAEKIVKVFDMKKFQSNVNRELRRAYPDRRRLETQCLSAVAFVKSETDILDCPIWVLIINVVAMDMLKSKLPPVQRPLDIKNRPRIPIPDEDPYSVAGNGPVNDTRSGSNSNGGHVAVTREQLMLQAQQLSQKRSEKPPKLPPRDNIYHPHDIPKPDYDDILEEDTRVNVFRGKSDKGKDLNKKYDDPYYCGLRARVPKFVSKSGGGAPIVGTATKNRGGSKESTVVAPTSNGKRMSVASKMQHHQQQQHQSMAAIHQLAPMHQHHHQHSHAHQLQKQHPYGGSTMQIHHSDHYGQHGPATAAHMMYHAKSYESGIDSEMVESPYNHIYGRIPLPTRGYIPTPRTMYIGEWD